jgi:hypothetical protein
VIKIMKRSIITLGALFCVFFIVSTGTAVPQAQSNLIIDKIDELSYLKNKLQDKISEINTFISQKIKDIGTLGLIDSIINLLIKLIEFILKIGEFISSILNIGGRILYIVNQIIYILETVINIINWILDLFNPQQLLS